MQAMRRLLQISPKKSTTHMAPRLASLKTDSSTSIQDDLTQEKQPEIKQSSSSPFATMFKKYREQSIWDTAKSVGPSLALTVLSVVTGIPITVINLDSLKKPLDYAASWFKSGSQSSEKK